MDENPHSQSGETPHIIFSPTEVGKGHTVCLVPQDVAPFLMREEIMKNKYTFRYLMFSVHINAGEPRQEQLLAARDAVKTAVSENIIICSR